MDLQRSQQVGAFVQPAPWTEKPVVGTVSIYIYPILSIYLPIYMYRLYSWRVCFSIYLEILCREERGRVIAELIQPSGEKQRFANLRHVDPSKLGFGTFLSHGDPKLLFSELSFLNGKTSGDSRRGNTYCKNHEQSAKDTPTHVKSRVSTMFLSF